jgi:magnesium chelatase family protein
VKYQSKVSGPLLDRIDLRIRVGLVPVEDLADTAPSSEHSSAVRARVQAARAIQLKRFTGRGIFTNAQLDNRMIQEFCDMDDDARKILRFETNRHKLSTRAYFRIHRVAQTIADLDNSTTIMARHVAEAVRYRMLDDASWAQ